jgi:hypothetical protein
VWPRDVAEHIGLAAASCAWAGAPQRFQLDERLHAIVPGNGKLVTDLLDVYRLQAHQPIDNLFSHKHAG